MSRRTMMAARIGPASLKSGPRSVYVCAPDTTDLSHAYWINAVLADVIRGDDRLLYEIATSTAAVDQIVAFAERHGLLVDATWPGQAKSADLVVAIVDPLGDGSLTSRARSLAAKQRADLIITELPLLPVAA